MRHHPKYISTCIVMIAALILLTGKKLMHNNSSLTLTSSSFKNRAIIPQQFTCDGKNISPALHWKLKSSKPVNSYVLIVDDPDAQKVVGKTFVHWIVVLPPQISDIPEGTSLSSFDAHAIELLNDSEKSTYKGPCPPVTSGIHSYRFTLFATTRTVENMKKEIKTVVNADDFKKGMRKDIVAWARITGQYQRKIKAS